MNVNKAFVNQCRRVNGMISFLKSEMSSTNFFIAPSTFFGAGGTKSVPIITGILLYFQAFLSLFKEFQGISGNFRQFQTFSGNFKHFQGQFCDRIVCEFPKFALHKNFSVGKIANKIVCVTAPLCLIMIF